MAFDADYVDCHFQRPWKCKKYIHVHIYTHVCTSGLSTYCCLPLHMHRCTCTYATEPSVCACHVYKVPEYHVHMYVYMYSCIYIVYHLTWPAGLPSQLGCLGSLVGMGYSKRPQSLSPVHFKDSRAALDIYMHMYTCTCTCTCACACACACAWSMCTLIACTCTYA